MDGLGTQYKRKQKDTSAVSSNNSYFHIGKTDLNMLQRANSAVRDEGVVLTLEGRGHIEKNHPDLKEYKGGAISVAKV